MTLAAMVRQHGHRAEIVDGGRGIAITVDTYAPVTREWNEETAIVPATEKAVRKALGY